MSIDQARRQDPLADGDFGFDDLDPEGDTDPVTASGATPTGSSSPGESAPEDADPGGGPENSDTVDSDTADGDLADDDLADQPGRKPDRHRHRAERTLIRRAVELSQILVAADTADRKLLAQAVGCPSDPGWLTAHILTVPRTGITAPLEDLLTLRELSVVDQVAEIAFMDRPRAAALWGLLTASGTVQGRRPAVPIVAAKAAVAGLAGLSDADEARMRRVIELVKGA